VEQKRCADAIEQLGFAEYQLQKVKAERDAVISRQSAMQEQLEQMRNAREEYETKLKAMQQLLIERERHFSEAAHDILREDAKERVLEDSLHSCMQALVDYQSVVAADQTDAVVQAKEALLQRDALLVAECARTDMLQQRLQLCDVERSHLVTQVHLMAASSAVTQSVREEVCSLRSNTANLVSELRAEVFRVNEELVDVTSRAQQATDMWRQQAEDSFERQQCAEDYVQDLMSVLASTRMQLEDLVSALRDASAEAASIAPETAALFHAHASACAGNANLQQNTCAGSVNVQQGACAGGVNVQQTVCARCTDTSTATAARTILQGTPVCFPAESCTSDNARNEHTMATVEESRPRSGSPQCSVLVKQDPYEQAECQPATRLRWAGTVAAICQRLANRHVVCACFGAWRALVQAEGLRAADKDNATLAQSVVRAMFAEWRAVSTHKSRAQASSGHTCQETACSHPCPQADDPGHAHGSASDQQTSAHRDSDSEERKRLPALASELRWMHAYCRDVKYVHAALRGLVTSLQRGANVLSPRTPETGLPEHPEFGIPGHTDAWLTDPGPDGADGVIGVALDDKIRVLDMVKYSPAYESGMIHVGDTVLAVDGVRVLGKRDAADALSGRAATAVRLTVEHAGEVRDVWLTRCARSDILQRLALRDDLEALGKSIVSGVEALRKLQRLARHTQVGWLLVYMIQCVCVCVVCSELRWGLPEASAVG
jgi:hypothetical protein